MHYISNMAALSRGATLLPGIVCLLVVVSHVSAEQYRLKCPAGWKLVLKETCVKFTAPLNWYEATQKCKTEGGLLFDGGGTDDQSIASQAIISQGRSGGGWFWVNAAFLQVEAGKVWTFNDGVPMTYFYWRSGEPSNDKGKENYIITRDRDAGMWNDEEDTTGYTFFKKEHGVVCQDNSKPGVPIFKIGTRNYTIITGSNVHAPNAETLCKIGSGGTLARITDLIIQTEIWRQATDKEIREDYWIAGQRRKVNGVAQTGIYWLDSKKSISPAGISGFGAGLSVAASVGSAQSIKLGIFDSSQPRSAICTTKPDRILVTTTSTTSTTTTAPTTASTSTATTSTATTSTTTVPTTTSTTPSTSITSTTAITLTAKSTTSVQSTISPTGEPSTTVAIEAISTKIFDLTTGFAVDTTVTSDTTASSSRTSVSSSSITSLPDATTAIANQQSTAGLTTMADSVTSSATIYPSGISASTQEVFTGMQEKTEALSTVETLETQSVTIQSTDFTTHLVDVENRTTTAVLISHITSSTEINNITELNNSTAINDNTEINNGSETSNSTENNNNTEINNPVTSESHSSTTASSFITSTHTLNWTTLHNNKTKTPSNETPNTSYPSPNETQTNNAQSKAMTTNSPQTTTTAIPSTLVDGYNQTYLPADNKTAMTTTSSLSTDHIIGNNKTDPLADNTTAALAMTTTAVLSADIIGNLQTDDAKTTETTLTKQSEVTDVLNTTTATFINTTENYTANSSHPYDTTDPGYSVTKASPKAADSKTASSQASIGGATRSTTTHSSQSTASSETSFPDKRTSLATDVTESIGPTLTSKPPTMKGNTIVSATPSRSIVSTNPHSSLQTGKVVGSSSSSKTVGTTNKPDQTRLTSDPSLSSTVKISNKSSTTTDTPHRGTGTHMTVRPGTKSTRPTISNTDNTPTPLISITQNITNPNDNSELNIGIDVFDDTSGNNRVFDKTSKADESNSNFLSRMFSAEIRDEFAKPGAIAGVVVGGVALILIIIGMILAVVYRKRHVSKEPSIVQSDLEMTDYDNEDTNPLRTDNIIDKLASYERSLPRVNANSVSTNNNKGYEFYTDSKIN